MVLPMLAQEFRVKSSARRSPIEQIVRALAPRHVLLVFDNFEHPLSGTPVWLVMLLERCPRLKVLATSRIALNISAEHRYLVPPLAVTARDSEGGGDPAAVTLLAHRARAVRSDFMLNDSNRAVVDEICRRLDGLPLAIELAAARVIVMHPLEILGRLTDRFSLLSGGQRDASPRLRTMRDAVAWSYDVLAPNEQWLFRQLSVLNGTFPFAAAERVGGGSGMNVISGLAALVDGSLVDADGDMGGETRYAMLETLREYGLELLIASGEEEAARDRMAEWCLDLARAISPNELMPAQWA